MRPHEKHFCSQLSTMGCPHSTAQREWETASRKMKVLKTFLFTFSLFFHAFSTWGLMKSKMFLISVMSLQCTWEEYQNINVHTVAWRESRQRSRGWRNNCHFLVIKIIHPSDLDACTRHFCPLHSCHNRSAMGDEDPAVSSAKRFGSSLSCKKAVTSAEISVVCEGLLTPLPTWTWPNAPRLCAAGPGVHGAFCTDFGVNLAFLHWLWSHRITLRLVQDCITTWRDFCLHINLTGWHSVCIAVSILMEDVSYYSLKGRRRKGQQGSLLSSTSKDSPQRLSKTATILFFGPERGCISYSNFALHLLGRDLS